MPSRDDVLVSTQWVADHLNDSKVKLIEVDVDTTQYDEGHAPGAVGFNWTSQLQDQVRRDIASKEQIEELLGEAGVSNGDTIVLYGDNNNWFAAYAFWLLTMYGHGDLKLMDGGRKKWLEENRATTKDAAKPAKTSYKAKDADLGLRANAQEVLGAIGQRALVDVRSPAEYNGEIMAPPAPPPPPDPAEANKIAIPIGPLPDPPEVFLQDVDHFHEIPLGDDLVAVSTRKFHVNPMGGTHRHRSSCWAAAASAGTHRSWAAPRCDRPSDRVQLPGVCS